MSFRERAQVQPASQFDHIVHWVRQGPKVRPDGTYNHGILFPVTANTKLRPAVAQSKDDEGKLRSVERSDISPEEYDFLRKTSIHGLVRAMGAVKQRAWATMPVRNIYLGVEGNFVSLQKGNPTIVKIKEFEEGYSSKVRTVTVASSRGFNKDGTPQPYMPQAKFSTYWGEGDPNGKNTTIRANPILTKNFHNIPIPDITIDLARNKHVKSKRDETAPDISIAEAFGIQSSSLDADYAPQNEVLQRMLLGVAAAAVIKLAIEMTYVGE